MDWAHITVCAPAIGAAFLASTVEVVEAFTIVLAVGTLRGWKPAGLGTAAAVVTLALVIALLGPLLAHVPLRPLQLLIGLLLLIFGMGWLRKAILRAAGIIPLHDESAIFASQAAALTEEGSIRTSSLAWIAGLTAYKAVLLEGLEVAFIVVAIGSEPSLLVPAGIGALAACILVLFVGLLIHKPLSRVPENKLKFAVGVMLTSFGIFWTGEGIGIGWPRHDLVLLAIAGLILAVMLLAARALAKSFASMAVR